MSKIKKFFNEYKYYIISFILLLIIVTVFYIVFFQDTECPNNCSAYINGDIIINGKKCKVPTIQGKRCPTNCVVEEETINNKKVIKYKECNCNLEKPLKDPNILVQPYGKNVLKCPLGIECNDCNLTLNIINDLPSNPIKSELTVNFEPFRKSIYLTNFEYILHAYSNYNNCNVQLQILNNIDNKLVIPTLIRKIPELPLDDEHDDSDEEILFKLDLNQPILVNAGSILKLIFTNPNNDELYITNIPSLTLNYKHSLDFKE
jgi:hypothetical protein